MDDSEQTILEKITFLKICDAELGIIAWCYEEEYFGVCVCSLHRFDNLTDALHHCLESLEKNDHGESYH